MKQSMPSSFRDAPLGAGPESITTIGSMDSGLALRAPRNDGPGLLRFELGNDRRSFHLMALRDVVGDTARPRKTRSAWLRRRISGSSKRPRRAPTLDFGTVMILSTISREWNAQSIPLARFDREAEQWCVCLVGGEGAYSDGGGRIEIVILHDDHRPRLARIIPAAGHRPDLTSSHSSPQSETASMNA